MSQSGSNVAGENDADCFREGGLLCIELSQNAPEIVRQLGRLKLNHNFGISEWLGKILIYINGGIELCGDKFEVCLGGGSKSFELGLAEVLKIRQIGDERFYLWANPLLLQQELGEEAELVSVPSQLDADLL